jgi:hypothetical protein
MGIQRHPRKHLRMRDRVYFGYITTKDGEKLGLEKEALIAAIKTVAVIAENEWHISSEKLADFGVALSAAARARADLAPEMPSKKACLDPDWFKFQDKLHDIGMIFTLKDVAKCSGRAYETVKKAHEVYISDK